MSLRPVDQERRTARCAACKQVAAGWTLVSRSGWTGSGSAAQTEAHLCDACADETEAPLEVVLQNYLDEDADR